MHVKFYVEPCEAVPGRWQVIAERGDGRTFLLESSLTKKRALASVRLAERAALFCGATVIA
jgi:hypothetical protein